MIENREVRKTLNELIREDLNGLIEGKRKSNKNILGITVVIPFEGSKRVYFLGGTLGIVIYPSPEIENGDSHIMFSILENYDTDDPKSWRIIEYQSHSLFISRLRNVLIVAEEWMKKNCNVGVDKITRDIYYYWRNKQ